MGGATEDDNAMKWFLEQANGGDVLILRTSGSDGYNQYFYSQLGISVNSVETIVFDNASASNQKLYTLKNITSRSYLVCRRQPMELHFVLERYAY